MYIISTKLINFGGMLLRATSVVGGFILLGILNVIAQSRLIPVIILLLIFISFAVIEIGAVLAEYTRRVKLSASDIDTFLKKIATLIQQHLV